MVNSATKQSSTAPQTWIASLTLAMTSETALAARSRPSFTTTTPDQKLSRSREEKARGDGAPKDAIQPMSAAQTSARKWRRLSAFGAEARRRIRCLRNASASGRARLPAHRCSSRQGFDLLTQLQAMLPGMFAQRALPAGSQAQCRDSTSRRGRSTAGRDARSRPGAVCETARRRRIPLRNQDRIRNAPLDERDSHVLYLIW